MHAASRALQLHRLFSELPTCLARKFRLYDKSLLVNKDCNKTVSALRLQMDLGFNLSEAQLDKSSGTKWLVRIGKPEEYRWVAGFFAAFGREPHNFTT